MTKKAPDTVSVARITVIGTIAVAVISLIGNLILGYWQLTKNLVDGQPASTPETTSLAIEQFPQRVYSFYGSNENPGGLARMDVIFGGAVIKPHYFLSYTIPLDRDGNAGMVFQFDKGQDVTEFSAIEINIQFSEGNIPIDLYMKDDGGGTGDHVRITSKGTEETTFRYELGIFKNVNFKALKEVGFNSDQSMVRGQHSITIFGISFVR